MGVRDGDMTPISSTSKRVAGRHRDDAVGLRNTPSTTRTKAITPRYWS